VEIVRYRPGEAVRWLHLGAENIRRTARARGRSVVEPDGAGVTDNLKTAAGALYDFGRGAYTDLMHRQIEASEYVLLDRHFDIVRGTNIKTVLYERVRRVELKGDRAILHLEKGEITIKPFAHVVAGRAKVPVGWVRNGMEVPFELLIEELAARCGVEVEES
jgi:hypothetical protein